MDPLSVISGVAGVASAAAALASSLHEIIANVRGAPREMAEIADGTRELSGVLRQMRIVLRAGREKKLFRSELYRSIRSATRRIESYHEDVYELIKSDRGLGRIMWAFRKARAEGLLAKVDSLKLTVSLMMNTASLALACDKETQKYKYGLRHGQNDADEDERVFLRRQVETLIQASKQTIQYAVSSTLGQRDYGTQTEAHLFDASAPTAPAGTSVIGNSEDITAEETQGHSTQIQRWGETQDDNARWLYRLVFGESHDFAALQRVRVSDLAAASKWRPKAEVVDKLLQEWSYLDDDEIEELQDLPSERDNYPELQALEHWSDSASGPLHYDDAVEYDGAQSWTRAVAEDEPRRMEEEKEKLKRRFTRAGEMSNMPLAGGPFSGRYDYDDQHILEQQRHSSGGEESVRTTTLPIRDARHHREKKKPESRAEWKARERAEARDETSGWNIWEPYTELSSEDDTVSRDSTPEAGLPKENKEKKGSRVERFSENEADSYRAWYRMQERRANEVMQKYSTEPYIEQGYENDTAAAQANPLDDKLKLISSLKSYYTTELLPMCSQFRANPPPNLKQRKDEHRKLSELVLQQVLLKLDGIDANGQDEVRRRRKSLVQEVQEMLNGLDKARDKETWR